MWQELGSSYAIALLHNNMGDGGFAPRRLGRGPGARAKELWSCSSRFGSEDFMAGGLSAHGARPTWVGVIWRPLWNGANAR